MKNPPKCVGGNLRIISYQYFSQSTVSAPAQYISQFYTAVYYLPVPKIIDPVFAKTSPKRSFSMTEYERLGLVFTKTRVYKFGHWSSTILLLR